MFIPSYRTQKNGVPILRKDEIDTIAEQYVSDFCPDALKEPKEIDIDSFCMNYLGLKQDYQYLSNNCIYLGMMVFNDTNKVVVYNPSKNRAEYCSVKARTVIIDNSLLDESQEHRCRFTIGHECFHDVFHSGYYSFNPNQMSLFDSTAEPMIQCRAVALNSKPKSPQQWDCKDTMEWQSNYASSAILMPRSMVLQLIQSMATMDLLFRKAMYVRETSRVFNVSMQAAQYRLQGLGILSKNEKIPDILELDCI